MICSMNVKLAELNSCHGLGKECIAKGVNGYFSILLSSHANLFCH